MLCRPLFLKVCGKGLRSVASLSDINVRMLAMTIAAVVAVVDPYIFV